MRSDESDVQRVVRNATQRQQENKIFIKWKFLPWKQMKQFNPSQIVTNSRRTKHTTKKLHIKEISIQRSWCWVNRKYVQNNKNALNWVLELLNVPAL